MQMDSSGYTRHDDMIHSVYRETLSEAKRSVEVNYELVETELLPTLTLSSRIFNHHGR